MGKQEQIAKLLEQGASAGELIKQGYARGTVYKVANRLKQKNEPDNGDRKSMDDLDLEIEKDPEIVEIKKALRKAVLDRQLGELQGIPSSDQRLAQLENRLNQLQRLVRGVLDTHEYLEARVAGSPLTGLRQEYECGCGAIGNVASIVICTSCGRESRFGWFPKSSG